MNSSDMPERVWLSTTQKGGLSASSVPGRAPCFGTEYLRADLTPSAAARVLLESPEAVERMVEAMTKMAAERDGRDWSKAIIREVYSPRYVAEAREMALNALRAIAGEEG